MSAENKAVSRRFHEAIGKGSAQAVQAELAPNFVAHFPGVPGPLDPEGFKQLVNVFASAFPESHFDIDDEFAVGDKVVTRWTYRAVHRGEFQGLPPTGKQVAMTGITILDIAGGKVVENSVELDQLGLLQQLGVVPPPPGVGRGVTAVAHAYRQLVDRPTTKQGLIKSVSTHRPACVFRGIELRLLPSCLI